MEQMKYQVYFLFYEKNLSSTVLVVITSSSSKICQCDKLWKNYLLVLSRKFLVLHQGTMTHHTFWQWSRKCCVTVRNCFYCLTVEEISSFLCPWGLCKLWNSGRYHFTPHYWIIHSVFKEYFIHFILSWPFRLNSFGTGTGLQKEGSRSANYRFPYKGVTTAYFLENLENNR